MRLPGSLRARIALAAVAAVGICGLLAGALLLAAVERDGRNQVDDELRARADSILRRPGDAYGRGRRRGEVLLRGSGTFAQVAYGDNVTSQAGDVPDAAARRARAATASRRSTSPARRGARSRSTSSAVGDPRLQIASSLAPVEERVAAPAGSCCCSARSRWR